MPDNLEYACTLLAGSSIGDQWHTKFFATIPEARKYGDEALKNHAHFKAYAIYQHYDTVVRPVKEPLKWKRSESGCVATHCGRYEIEPIYNHACTPQAFTLYVYDVPGDARTRHKIYGWLDSQREGKQKAERDYYKR